MNKHHTSAIDSKLSPELAVRRLCSAEDNPLALPPVILVLAHPDDEVIGAGSRLPRLGRVELVYLTDGAPRNMHDATAAGFATREDYAAARRHELSDALALAGIDMKRTLHLNIPDQEASLYLVPLVHALAEHFSARRPGLVITHPYEGGHPDHDAAAFAVHAACVLMRAQGAAAPPIIEMTSYHRGVRGIEVGVFLPGEGPAEGLVALSDGERSLKKRMLDCFATQRDTLRWFSTAVERFRPAPEYRFTVPPHEGQLFYEQFEWGMTGPRWRELARAALVELEVGRPC